LVSPRLLVPEILDLHDGPDLERSSPSDPQGGYRPQAFYSITGFSLYMSRKF
jgi:hypothetical protein